jgi:hypothetical protein
MVNGGASIESALRLRVLLTFQHSHVNAMVKLKKIKCSHVPAS